MDKKYIKTLIRRSLIRDPSISVRRLGEICGITKDTALKYRNEIVREKEKRMEKEIEKLKKRSLEAELVDMEEEIKEVVRELWLVVSNASSDKDRVSAIRAIVNARKNLFDIKFDAGLFIRKLGESSLNIPELTKLVKEHVGSEKDNKIDSEL